MIKVAGYGRMSTDKQQMSPEIQEKLIKDWFKYQHGAGKWPDGAEFIGMFVDNAVTSKIDLLDREAGQHLVTTLDPGDVIVVAKYNRAFRSAADAERTLERCDEAGIKFVFLDLNIDTSTANGKMLAGILAVVSKHERDLRSETTKDAHWLRVRKGLPITCAPPGWRNTVIKGRWGRKKVLAIDKAKRMVATAAMVLIRNGNTREETWLKMRPFCIKHNMTPLAQQTLVRYAAAACLGFPKMTNGYITKMLGYQTDTIEFIRRDDHDVVKKELAAKMKQMGFEYEPPP